jgi:hypothetical protein
MDNGCFAATCTAASLKTQAFPAANRCTVKKSVNEDHDGWVQQLPGMDMAGMA